MFEMRPFFMVVPLVAGRREPFEPEGVAMARGIVGEPDGDTYICQLAERHPGRWCEAILYLEGIDAPEGADFDYRDSIRARAVKRHASRCLLGADQVTLRNFRRNERARLLADVYTGHCNLSALLADIVREE